MLRQALCGFELSDAESAVYAATLALGSAQVSLIARRAGINRAYTYDILFALCKKGLVQEAAEGNIKQFISAPPHRLVALIEKKERLLARRKRALIRALPDLQKLAVKVCPVTLDQNKSTDRKSAKHASIV